MPREVLNHRLRAISIKDIYLICESKKCLNQNEIIVFKLICVTCDKCFDATNATALYNSSVVVTSFNHYRYCFRPSYSEQVRPQWHQIACQKRRRKALSWRDNPIGHELYIQFCELIDDQLNFHKICPLFNTKD